jgi:hypothetical protein
VFHWKRLIDEESEDCAGGMLGKAKSRWLAIERFSDLVINDSRLAP